MAALVAAARKASPFAFQFWCAASLPERGAPLFMIREPNFFRGWHVVPKKKIQLVKDGKTIQTSVASEVVALKAQGWKVAPLPVKPAPKPGGPALGKK